MRLVNDSDNPLQPPLMTNWYIEEDETPPLGLAVSMLGGCISRLEAAILSRDPQFIRKHVIYSSQISDLYRRALIEAPKDSVRTKRNQMVGTAMLQGLDTIRRTAQSFLSSTVQTGPGRLSIVRSDIF